MMKALRQQWVLDIQWSDMKKELGDEAMQMWRDQSMLHNDVCFWKFTEECWYDVKNNNYPYPKIGKYITENVPEGEEVWIHWWW